MVEFPLTFAEFLDAKREEPYYFGLGFIKVRLDHIRSMNFYDPELGAELPEEEVHDHRYDFTSQILGGSLTNQMWDVTPLPLASAAPDADGELWWVSCRPGQQDVLYCEAGSTPMNTISMTRGSWYTMKNYQFHAVRPGPDGCITGLRRTSPILHENARVLRPIGGAKVCPYARRIDSAELYTRIEKLYGTLRPDG